MRTVCYIDDKIPIADFPKYFEGTKLIDQQVLRFLLKNDTTDWSEDENVKGVIASLLDHSSDWECYAFTAPQFFINHRDNGYYINPDIILYDWDYNDSPSSDSSEKNLLELLKSTYSIIIIYTGADKTDEIKDILRKDELMLYTDRVDIMEKSKDTVNKVIEKAKIMFNSNFSYKYAKELLYNSNRSLNEVLAEISSLSVNQFVISFGYYNRKNDKFIVEPEEFASIIFDKYKQKLIEYLAESDNLSVAQKDIAQDQENIIKKIWSYRLYYTSKSDQVKQGDIIKYQDDLFLVFSSDCHMERFWCKNYGFLALIPLYKIEKNGKSKKLFSELEKSNSFSVSSLVNSNGLNNISILPAIPVEDKYSDYILFPKGIKTVEIPLFSKTKMNAKNIKNSSCLTYYAWKDIKKIVSISESFKSPLIQFIQDNITGYGVPDFPNKLAKELSRNFKEALK